MSMVPIDTLTVGERRILRHLNAPRKIQDFLETLPYSFDHGSDMLRSPRRVLRERTAHCMEGALLAAVALWVNGQRPFLLDLRSTPDDLDHVATPFRVRGLWGAISKTNYAVLRYRDPVYRTVRELAMSYFNEYYLDNGKKTMRDYSEPYDIIRHHGTAWMTREDDLWDIAEALDSSPHQKILTPAQMRGLRPVDPIERKAGLLTIFKKKHAH